MLNECVWFDTYLLQIINQQELQKLIKFFAKVLDFKDIKFPLKIRNIHKIEKKIVLLP